ncbi:MAG: polysaccharide pyruvyl transferase family protein [Gillisia sp.]
MTKTIRLFWWSETRIQKKQKENYGDLLGKYLVEKISGKKVAFAWPKKWSYKDWFAPVYVTVGSILTHVNKKCVVWGSGIISNSLPVKSATFLAVRGPRTREFLIEKGYAVPEVYGDPALLLPNYYFPKIEKKYRFGVIPHYNDYELVKSWFREREDVLLIDLMTNDVETTTDKILSCEKIVSSSLHGIIVGHTYGIPAVWQKFSGKVFGDDIKYRDYLESVELPFYAPEIRNNTYSAEELEKLFHNYPVLPKKEKLEELRKNLMEVCPF